MIKLPKGLVFAEVEGCLGSYCVHREGDWDWSHRKGLTLCRALVVAVTPDGWGPEDWVEVHAECRMLARALVRCPACGTHVGCDGGRVSRHGACVGGGMPVRGGR